jgi:hypothetical protein
MPSSAGPSAAQPTKGPYPPEYAALGGEPTTGVDDPITAVFLLLFIIGAVSHMTILQVNKHRGHKFIMSGLLFSFSMTRVIACTMRIVWSTRLNNLNIALAAQIFVAAGVIILFIVNLIFTQRIIRATHPHLGWAKTFSAAFIVAYACIITGLIANVTTVVQSFFSLSTNTRRIDRDVQLTILTMFAVAAFLPIPLILGSIIIPKKVRVEKFGTGRFRTKIFVLLFASTVLTLGAAFRAGTDYVPRPVNDPAWYHSKACFYLFDFTVEIIVVYLYAAIRVDKRFHVPNKSRGPGDYSRNGMPEIRQSFHEIQRRSIFDRVLDEELVFDDQVFNDQASTRLGTPVEPVEKFIDIEMGLVIATPGPTISTQNTHDSHRRWSNATIADIESVISRPDHSRTSLNPAAASATSMYSRPES